MSVCVHVNSKYVLYVMVNTSTAISPVNALSAGTTSCLNQLQSSILYEHSDNVVINQDSPVNHTRMHILYTNL